MAKSSKTLSAAEYRNLLRDVRGLLKASKTNTSDEKLLAYWSIGKRIHSQRIASDAGYIKSVFRDLASDASLAQRTLYDAVHFFQSYRSPPKGSKISWTHYRQLLKLTTKKDRSFYVELAASESWSTRRLQQAIAQGLHEGNAFEDQELERPTDPLYLYRARLVDVIDADTLDFDVDLGFDVARRLRARLARIDAPELRTKKGRVARDFVLSQLIDAKTLVIKSEKVDLHGRYIAHVFFARRAITHSECFKSGTYLNDLLVREGYADFIG